MEQISTDPENMIVLKIVKELLQTQKDVMLVCSYIPPYDSIYWKNCQYRFGIEQLEQCILDLRDSFGDFHILLACIACCKLKQPVNVLERIKKYGLWETQ